MSEKPVREETPVPGEDGGSRHSRDEFLKRGAAATAALAGGSVFFGASSKAAAGIRARNRRAQVSGEISVRYWGAGIERTAWDNRIKYFNSRYPNVKVTPQLLTRNGYDEFPALLTQIAAGNPPDVIRVLNFQPTQLVAQGDVLLPLDDFIKGEPNFWADFTATARKGARVGARTYAIPQNGEPYVLYYNADAFKKAGLTPPPALIKQGRWNQNTFRDAARKLKANAGVRYGAAFETWNYDVFIFMGGGRVLNAQLQPIIDRGSSPRTLQFLADMIKEGTSPSPDVASGSYVNFFQTNQLGMYISGSWWGKYMPPVIKNSFQWGAVRMPSFWGKVGSKYELDSLSISKDSKNPEAAWAFIKTVTDPRGQTLWTLAATPTRNSVLNSATFRKDKVVPAVVEMIRYSTFTPFTKVGQAVDTASITELAPMWLGQETAAKATRDAAAALRKALSK
jgi:ABC-type glycerol-3-phosphate transport system substrate-binding protein